MDTTLELSGICAATSRLREDLQRRVVGIRTQDMDHPPSQRRGDKRRSARQRTKSAPHHPVFLASINDVIYYRLDAHLGGNRGRRAKWQSMTAKS